MRLADLDVDDSYYFMAGDDRGGEEGLVLVFREFSKVLKAWVEIGFFADRDQAALAGYPAGEAFIHTQAKRAESARGWIVGRAEQQISFVEEIEQAGIAVHEFEDESVDGGKNLFEAEFFRHETADLLEEAQLLLGAV